MVSHNNELIHAGDYVKFHAPVNEVQQYNDHVLNAFYLPLVHVWSTLQLTASGATLCFVRGFQAMALADGTSLLNEFDCPLFSLAQTILSVDSSHILACSGLLL